MATDLHEVTHFSAHEIDVGDYGAHRTAMKTMRLASSTYHILRVF